MDFQVDVWLRGTDYATTELVTGIAHDPAAWTDSDVSAVLTGMLRAIDRLKNPPGDPERTVVLRGFSWIVNPYEDGGVVIALEMMTGAAVGGPFNIDRRSLESMIARVVTHAAARERSSRVH